MIPTVYYILDRKTNQLKLRVKKTKTRLILGGGREDSEQGYSLLLSLSCFIAINRQTLGSWGVVHAEQMHPLAVSLHSPHNEPDGTHTDRRHHFHSPQDRGRGHTLPWRHTVAVGQRGAWVAPVGTQAETLGHADRSVSVPYISLPSLHPPSAFLSFSTIFFFFFFLRHGETCVDDTHLLHM